MTVEGVGTESDAENSWDGVDCALLYDGDSIGDAQRVVVQQLKYSGAHPNTSWSVSRLASGRNGNVASSPIRRLADAYIELVKARPGKAVQSISIAFVTNQPISRDLAKAIAEATKGVPAKYRGAWKSGDPDLHRLVHASGLRPAQFAEFATLLDLRGSTGSRFSAEEEMLSSISKWTDTELRETANRLRKYVRDRMLPEAAKELITREKVLLQFGVSDEHSLFPCPPDFRKVAGAVPRGVAKAIADQMVAGTQRMCLHGGGGVGKTTVLQEVKDHLPDGSQMVMFDCYGGGSYLDASALRHRSDDAFLQLANDLGRSLQLPLLLEPHGMKDPPRAFRKRLDRAAETLAEARPGALLVVAIDAADNSVTAAALRSPPEQSFVHDLMSFESLPSNVRLLISCRTGRLKEVKPPSSFHQLPLPPFERAETAENVRRRWAAQDEWIDDFHHLSGGVPRVQSYAFENASPHPSAAIDLLRPVGKKLDQVFQERFALALRKVGREAEFKRVCAGLVALPRPIPISELAAVLDIPPEQIADVCADLAPGVRNRHGFLTFADEDFEHFVRDSAQDEIGEIRGRAADRLFAQASLDAYAALNVAPALLESGRHTELLDLVERESEPPPNVVHDPVRRREIQVQRLQVAIRVCRGAQDPARALRFVLIGAEAIKTEGATKTLLSDNPGLTARYARETASRLILGDPDMLSEHGPLLLALRAEDAARGDAIAVREGRRQFSAWYEARSDAFREAVAEHEFAQPWNLSEEDLAAAMYANLLTEGPEIAVKRHRSARPLQFAAGGLRHLIDRLLAEGRHELVSEISRRLPPAWAVFAYVPLALANQDVDVDRLARGLAALLRRFTFGPKLVAYSGYSSEGLGPHALDLVLTAAEILSRHGHSGLIEQVITPFLDPDVRRVDRLHDFEARLLDAILRSHSLSVAMGRVFPSGEGVLFPRPPQTADQRSRRRDGHEEQHDRQLGEIVAAIHGFYAARARIFVRGPDDAPVQGMKTACEGLERKSWELDRRHSFGDVRAVLASSLSGLLACGVNAESVLAWCIGVRRGWGYGFGRDSQDLFKRLASVPALHSRLILELASAASDVRKHQIGAAEKSSTLAAMARVLALVSTADADEVFKLAVDVASELDDEIMDQVRLLGALAARGNGHFEDARACALELAEVVHDGSVRLQANDHFPWSNAFAALSTLDMAVALACAARWQDTDTLPLESSLGDIVKTALSEGSLSVAQGLAILGMLDRPGRELSSVTSKADADGDRKAGMIAEEVARDILVDRAYGTVDVCDFVARRGSGFWSKQLRTQNEFVQRLPKEKVDGEPLGARRKSQHSRRSVSWKLETLFKAEDLLAAATKVVKRSHKTKTYRSMSDVLAEARGEVPAARRIEHLEALLALQHPDDAIDALLSAVQDWSGSPAVRNWWAAHLPALITEQLPTFAAYLPWEDRRLSPAISVANISDDDAATAILEGIQRNAAVLGASRTFALAGIVGLKLKHTDAADLCAWYSHRLASRIDVGNWDGPSRELLPESAPDGVGRFLFALLGDVDLRVRWKAAHALRRLARLGDQAAVRGAVDQYDRQEEMAFRDPKAPFYWLAARLWLVIALDRIALETPEIAAPYGPKLLEVALSRTFPHLLIRSYAADASTKLVEAGRLALTPQQADDLAAVNTSSLPRANKRPGYGEVINSLGSDDDQRRFRFDAMDSLRYWYDPWLRVFPLVEPEAFLREAERWIIDEWKVVDEKPYGSREPRRRRFGERSWSLSSNRHGTVPTLENYRNHLEWHAMWCTAGRLLETSPLAPPDEWGSDELPYRIGREKLTVPPLWLADITGPTPLEAHLWRPPATPISEWLHAVSDQQFLGEIRKSYHPDYIVVHSYTEVQWKRYEEERRVSSALVSSDTALALVRALQTIDVSFDYYLCPEGHDLEIDEGPYVLKGWIDSRDGDPGLDEHDAFRNRTRRLEVAPGKAAKLHLGLTRKPEHPIRWYRPGREEPSFIFEAWGDREREDERRLSYQDAFLSRGYRLLARRDDVKELLAAFGLDLISEIGITRRDRGKERSDLDEEGSKRSEFDRVVLFRGTGKVQVSERSLGAW